MPCPPKMNCMHFTSTSTCIYFLSGFYFLTPMDYSPWSEGKFWPFWRQMKKGQNLQNRKDHAHQNWIACISRQPLLAWIFWGDSILWPPWTEGKFWPFWRQTKKGQNLQNRRCHAHQNWFPCISNQPLIAWIFWADSIFWPPWTIAHGPKGNFDRFEGKWKRGKISKTEKTMPTKIELPAFHVNLYLHEFFEQILFLDPHGL